LSIDICQVRIEEAGAEPVRAFEVGLPQDRLQKEAQIQINHQNSEIL
jgi:hypothetical protein